jgi:hypothetical protein
VTQWTRDLSGRKAHRQLIHRYPSEDTVVT